MSKIPGNALPILENIIIVSGLTSTYCSRKSRKVHTLRGFEYFLVNADMHSTTHVWLLPIINYSKRTLSTLLISYE